VLDGLAHAHARKALHRDIKPDNILLARAPDFDPGDVKISDFSIARLAQDSVVRATGLLGTPAYMPPELLARGTFSAASDVYAAGVVLYELLAGRTPFGGSGNVHTISYRHVRMLPPRLPVPAELWRVVSTMLAKDPDLRLPAAATAAALRELPPALLDAAPLPPQPEPAQWAETGGVPGPAAPSGMPGGTGPAAVMPLGPVSVRDLPAGLDVGRTHLHGGPAEVEPLARTGAVAAIAPMPGAGDAGATQLGEPIERPTAPVLAPEVTLAPAKGSRAWRWVGGSVALLVAVAAVLWSTGVIPHGGGGPPNKTPPPATAVPEAPAPVERPGDALPSGLRIDKVVSYDTGTGLLAVDLTISAKGDGLAGDVLTAFPPLTENGDCPAGVTATGATIVPMSTSTGISVPCTYALKGLPLLGGQPVTVTLSAPAEMPEDLGGWADSIDTRVGEALAVVKDNAFALQRAEGLSVEMSGKILKVNDAIDYNVKVLWSNGGESPVYRSTALPTANLPLLDAFTGGRGFDSVTVQQCGAARPATGATRNYRLFANNRQEGCDLTVTVGQLTTNSPATFSVYYQSS
jgi:serine/threonine-protein kinase